MNNKLKTMIFALGIGISTGAVANICPFCTPETQECIDLKASCDQGNWDDCEEWLNGYCSL